MKTGSGAPELFGELSKWGREDLEIAATIDYVQKCNPSRSSAKLLEHVRAIKDNFPPDFIDSTHGKWSTWKNSHGFGRTRA